MLDNFLSEHVEKLLIETLEKNPFLVEVNVKENRLSSSCF